ncbi:MAG: hypothetical protein K2G56_00240, partial [Eubacterium sp.]|nr:hypothetical protein [Eubacterium sp.]
MKNRDLYKGAMSGVHHSNSAVEKLYEMTIDKKKTSKGIWFKRVACFVLAFAVLVVGGEFGINAIQNKDKATDALSVMVVYAGDNGNLSLGGKSEQELFFGIYNAPIDDKEACEKAAARFYADKNALIKNLDKVSEKGSYGGYSSKNYIGYSEKQDKDTAQFYVLQGGFFELNLEDYSDVKFFKVKNESEYGMLMFEYKHKDEEYDNILNGENLNISDDIIEEAIANLINHDFNIT